MYNYRCDICGAYLDPEEHCDCQDRRRRDSEVVEDMLMTDTDGQMSLKECQEELRYGNIIRN